ncbi:hypothetical protein YC2023_070042 [Brassica napus]
MSELLFLAEGSSVQADSRFSWFALIFPALGSAVYVLSPSGWALPVLACCCLVAARRNNARSCCGGVLGLWLGCRRVCGCSGSLPRAVLRRVKSLRVDHRGGQYYRVQSLVLTVIRPFLASGKCGLVEASRCSSVGCVYSCFD